MIISALLFKIGAAPFHNWIINILEGISWFNSFLILTWQKIAPLFLILYCKIYVMVISPFIILSALIGAVGGLNQVSLRKILVFSSINHLAWILTTLLFNKSIIIIYYIIYFIINLNIVMIFKKYSLSYLNQIFSVNNTFYIYVLFIIIFSLAGLPPFTGFISKWLTLELLSINNYFFLSLILILSSLITLFYYLQISYSSFLLINSKSKILFYSPVYLNILFITTSVISIFGLILILIFI